MSEGMSNLEHKINLFEELLEQMRIETREAHSVLKQIRQERREIERILKMEDIRRKVNSRVDEVVKTELDKIGPELRRQSNLIYDKVGKEIDKLIDLSLGKEFSIKNGNEDIRPQLAQKLSKWIREIIDDETNL